MGRGLKADLLAFRIIGVLGVFLALILVPVSARGAELSDGWNKYQTCEWRIDDAGCLTIRPLGNGVSGSFDRDDRFNLPWSYAKTTIQSVVFAGGIEARGSFSRFFAYYPALVSVNLVALDTSQVTDMSFMFGGCASLEVVDLSNLDTSSVTTMAGMFSGCSSLFTGHVSLEALGISDWNTQSVADMSGMFSNCNKLESVDFGDFGTSTVTTMAGMFEGCSSLESLNDVDFSEIETSSVKNVSYMFKNCDSLTNITFAEFSSLNLLSVEDMNHMFEDCDALLSADLSGLTLPSVADISGLFYGCDSLVSVNLAGISTPAVKSMENLFWNCSSLSSVDMSGVKAPVLKKLNHLFWGCSALKNIKLDGFNTSSVDSMASMFEGCSALTHIDLSDLSTASVAFMASMFKGCSSLASIDFTNFDFSSVTNMSSMLSNCSSLKSIDLSGHDMSSVISMSGLFSGCTSLQSVDLSDVDASSATNMGSLFSSCLSLNSVELSGMDTSAVTDMGGMFYGCESLISIDLSEIDTAAVRGMGWMFYGCAALESINLEGVETASVESMASMFERCDSLESIDLSCLNVSLVESMNGMFRDCDSLVSADLSGLDASALIDMDYIFEGCRSLSSVDFSDINTPSVQSMDWMFYYCRSLESLDLSDLDTSSVTSMHNMFSGSDLIELDISGFDTSNVTDMDGMFSGCTDLKNVDVSHFDTSSVTDMSYMFSGCSELESLDVSSFDTLLVTDMAGMFQTCNSLTSLDLSNFTTDRVERMDAMFFGCKSLSYLDLSGFDTSAVKEMGEDMFFNVPNPELANCPKLTVVIFGDKVSGIGQQLPVPDPNSIPGADGYWYNNEGEAFLPADIPPNEANVYYADRALVGTVPTPGSVEDENQQQYVTRYLDLAFPGGPGEANTTVEWNDGWFNILPSEYFVNSESLGITEYEMSLHELATTSAVLSAAAYDEEMIRKDLERLGFSEIVSYYPTEEDYASKGQDQVAYVIATKIRADGVPIVALVIRGTPSSGPEWLSNINVRDEGGHHTGFLSASNQVLGALDDYLANRASSYDLESVRLLITGHSRGGAVTNLAAASLNDGRAIGGTSISGMRIFAYTFESPNVSTLAKEDGYENIINIVNPDDIVSQIPLASWGYGRFGTTLVLPSKSNTNHFNDLYYEMNIRYSQYKGEDYTPIKYGAIVTHNIIDKIEEIAPNLDTFYSRLYPGYRREGFSLRYDESSTKTPYQVVQSIMKYIFLNDLDELANLVNLGFRNETYRNLVVSAIGGAAWNTLLGDTENLSLFEFLGRITDAIENQTASELGNALSYLGQAHSYEADIAWLESTSPYYLYQDHYSGVRIACPVDVRVYDENNFLVASIVENVVDEEVSANGLAANVIDGVKMVDIPSNGEYRLEITSRGNDEMDVTFETLDGSSQVALDTKTYQGININNGDVYSSVACTDVSASEFVLMKDGSEVNAVSVAAGPNPTYVMVNVESSDSEAGSVWGGGHVLKGSKTTVNAVAFENYEFLGWFDGEDLVSEDEEHNLRAANDVTLVAKFGLLDSSDNPDNPNTPETPDEPSGDVPPVPSRPTYRPEVEETDNGIVTASPSYPHKGDEVTITPEPDEGFVVGTVEVTDKDGEPVEVTDNGDGTWSFVQPAGRVTITVTFVCDGGALCPSAGLADVDQTQWYHGAVDWAVTSGAIVGYGDGSFGPGEALTRAQMATVLWRLAGRPAGEAALPADCSETEWYANGVAWALSAGVFGGYADGTFGPDDELSREQVACVLYNRAEAAGEDVSARADLSGFADASGLSEWAREAMSWAVAEGVFRGAELPDGSRELQPGRALTRAEAAALLMRLSAE